MQGSALLLTLMGGVALLLWSVRMVRTGMTRAFGASLRSLIGKACSNRFNAFATGIGVTGLLQSATATALLLASFASRKLVALPLALAIMLGADVGTALVAQVYTIDIKWIWAGLLFVGVVLFNASDKDEVRGGGRVLIGFGLMLMLAFAAGEPERGLGIGGFMVLLGFAFFVNSLFERREQLRNDAFPGQQPPSTQPPFASGTDPRLPPRS